LGKSVAIKKGFTRCHTDITVQDTTMADLTTITDIMNIMNIIIIGVLLCLGDGSDTERGVVDAADYWS
jgi:hypothetical protein